MMPKQKTPCSVCGYLHSYKEPLPVGKEAVCKKCSSKFVVERSLLTPDGVDYEVLNVQGGQGRTEVVGESYRRKELQELLSEMTYDEMDPVAMIPCTCQLIPETDNKHDSNAVRVEVNRHHLGYLPRDKAAQHREALKDMGKTLYRLNVDGVIMIDWEDGDDGPYVDDFQVWLKISWTTT